MKFEENVPSHCRDTSEQNFLGGGGFLRSFTFASTYSFCTLFKICHKMQTRILIKLKFGARKWLIIANLSAKSDKESWSYDQLFV